MLGLSHSANGNNRPRGSDHIQRHDIPFLRKSLDQLCWAASVFYPCIRSRARHIRTMPSYFSFILICSWAVHLSFPSFVLSQLQEQQQHHQELQQQQQQQRQREIQLTSSEQHSQSHDLTHATNNSTRLSKRHLTAAAISPPLTFLAPLSSSSLLSSAASTTTDGREDINGHPMPFCKRCEHHSAPSFYNSARMDGAGCFVMQTLLSVNFALRHGFNYIGTCDFNETASGHAFASDSELSAQEIARVVDARTLHKLERVSAMWYIFGGLFHTEEEEEKMWGSTDCLRPITIDKLSTGITSGKLVMEEGEIGGESERDREKGDGTTKMPMLYTENCYKLAGIDTAKTVPSTEIKRSSRQFKSVDELVSHISCMKSGDSNDRSCGDKHAPNNINNNHNFAPVTTYVVKRGIMYWDFFAKKNENYFDEVLDRDFFSFLEADIVRRSWRVLLASPLKASFVDPRLLPQTTIGRRRVGGLRVAIHIRRGDVNTKMNSVRYVPDEFYSKLVELLQKTDPNMDLHAYSSLEMDTTRKSFGFLEAKGVKMHYNEDESVAFAWAQQITADVFVMATSCFSVIAGLFNQNCVIRPKNYSNPRNRVPPRENWIFAEEAFQSPGLLTKCIDRARKNRALPMLGL